MDISKVYVPQEFCFLYYHTLQQILLFIFLKVTIQKGLLKPGL